MSVPQFTITDEHLSADVLADALEKSVRSTGEGCGAVCTFRGVVRATHKNRRVLYLDNEAFAPLAIKTFERIAQEVATDWPAAALAIHHRVGRLNVGDTSVVIVTAAAHRAESFQVCRYAIERVKQIAPVWKHEFFDDGDAWVEGATADVNDESARLRARELSCV